MKFSSFLLLTLVSISVKAQVSSKNLTCNPYPDEAGRYFPFTVKFLPSKAIVQFQGNSYELPFSEYRVDTTGAKMSFYQDSKLTVGTSFPAHGYTGISSDMGELGKKIITQGDCK